MTSTSEPIELPPVVWSIDHPDLLVGLGVVEGLDVGPSGGDLLAWFEAKLATVQDPPDENRVAIRQLLKKGGFKATGRNKPASEYLAEARRAGTFPRIYDVVDVINAISLETGWPISVLDLDRALPHSPQGALEIRFGRPGESYVFNTSGQVIDIAGLLGVAAADGPMLGNPVKDSMLSKVQPGTRRVAAVMYSSRAISNPDHMRHVCQVFVNRLGGGRVMVLPAPAKP